MNKRCGLSPENESNKIASFLRRRKEGKNPVS